ncbi:MAG: hypothetical protein AABW93_02170 [Nanoarchaeota archaeon]
MKPEKSIYEPLVKRYVQVEYCNGTCIVFGKLIQANERFLKLQPSFHIPLKQRSIDDKVATADLKEDLEELTKRFNRNALTIVDASKVDIVADVTTVFRDEWKLI